MIPTEALATRTGSAIANAASGAQPDAGADDAFTRILGILESRRAPSEKGVAVPDAVSDTVATGEADAGGTVDTAPNDEAADVLSDGAIGPVPSEAAPEVGGAPVLVNKGLSAAEAVDEADSPRAGVTAPRGQTDERDQLREAGIPEMRAPQSEDAGPIATRESRQPALGAQGPAPQRMMTPAGAAPLAGVQTARPSSAEHPPLPVRAVPSGHKTSLTPDRATDDHGRDLFGKGRLAKANVRGDMRDAASIVASSRPDRTIEGAAPAPAVASFAAASTSARSEFPSLGRELAAPLTYTDPAGSMPAVSGHVPGSSFAPPVSAAPAPTALPQNAVHGISEAIIRIRSGGSVDIALSPPELGHLKITVSAAESGLVVTLAAEREETGALLRRHLDQLGTAMRDLGLGDVSIGFSNGGASQDRGHGAGTGFMTVSSETVAIPSDRIVRPGPLGAPDKIDIRL